MLSRREDDQSRKHKAALYASRPGVVDFVRRTGRLPDRVPMGGAHIGARLLIEQRGWDIALTKDEKLVYAALLREELLPNRKSGISTNTSVSAKSGKKSRPNRVMLAEFEDSNMGLYFWIWTFWITRLKDGRYSVGCRQTVSEGRARRIPAMYPLTTGKQVWSALALLMSEAGYDVGTFDLSEIVSRIASLDPVLSKAVERAAKGSRKPGSAHATRRKR